MLDKKFQKTKENFICENCGFYVKGNGFTNHCPKCLYSKDVDIYPGDRKSTCLGLMKPVILESKKDSFILIHRCNKCGKEKRNKISSNDSFEALLNLAKSRN